jgi:hypothetical protein
MAMAIAPLSAMPRRAKSWKTPTTRRHGSGGVFGLAAAVAREAALAWIWKHCVSGSVCGHTVRTNVSLTMPTGSAPSTYSCGSNARPRVMATPRVSKKPVVPE